MSDAQAPKVSGNKKIKIVALLVVVCLLATAGAWWYKNTAAGAKKGDAGKNRPLPVAVVEAKVQDVEVFLSGLGTVTPLSSATIKSRVDGQLMQVLVKEGQAVKAGELLLVIDPRPFQVQLAQAEGQLRRDMAVLENARRDLGRYQDLVNQGAIARQQYDTQVSLVHQYEGAVITDRATADSARLQITYCRITAPFAGRVGLRQVDPGNMVRASDATGLLVVNQIAPITVSFTLPEDQLQRVLAKLRAGEAMRVDAYDREQSRKISQGQLASMDNQVDTSTGTVRLKALFANDQAELYPNQFVNAKLLIDVAKGAVVVPGAAVQRGQQGAYVFVVGPENTASTRPVSVGETADGLVVVLKGLNAGEKVVVEGAERLRDGAAVEVKAGKGEGGDKKQGQPAENATAAPEPKAGVQPSAQQAAQPAAMPVVAAKPATAKPEAQKPDTPKGDAKPAAKPEAKPQPGPKAQPAPAQNSSGPEALDRPKPHSAHPQNPVGQAVVNMPVGEAKAAQ